MEHRGLTGANFKHRTIAVDRKRIRPAVQEQLHLRTRDEDIDVELTILFSVQCGVICIGAATAMRFEPIA